MQQTDKTLGHLLAGGDDPVVRASVQTPAHLLGAAGLGLISALGADSGLGTVFLCLVLVSCGALFIAMMRNFWWVVLAAIVGSIPVIGWAVALYFLATRWEYVTAHKRAIACSFAMYTAPYVVASMFRGVPVLAFVAGASIWHLVAMSFYRRGYSPGGYLKTTALGPVVVLMLVLPFLDLDLDFDGADGADAGFVDNGAVVSQDAPAEWVEPYTRTLPDGDPLNNLSNPGGPAYSPPGYVEVDGHWRTVADGDPTNNLGAPGGDLPRVDHVYTDLPYGDDGPSDLISPSLNTSVLAATAVALANWYSDPVGPAGRVRYWDGQRWTEWVSTAGSAPVRAPSPGISPS